MSTPREVNIRNKKATFEYHIVESHTAGLQLTGSEIKSIRQGKASINEAFCLFRKGELWIKNMHISEYEHGAHYNHEPTRLRKLLLTKRELKRLEAKVREKGLTIVPVLLFIAETGYAKLEIALAKGKKTHDKRHAIKERDIKRDVKRQLRQEGY